MMNQFKNPTFGGFKPEAMKRIANSLGYSGEMSGFKSYLNTNPDKQNQMNQYNQTAMAMARGGVVQKFNQGGSAAALELLKQGDTAGAMSMMKSNVGLDSKLTSNDALQYMQKTGDQSGAEQILQSSVGLPTGTGATPTTIKDEMTQRATDPTLPEGVKVSPEKIAEDTDQFIKDTSGQVTGDIAPTAETADVSTA